MLNIARPISEEMLFGYTHPSCNLRYLEGKLPEIELYLTTSVVVADANNLKNVDTIWHHIEKYFREHDLPLFGRRLIDTPDKMFTLLYIEETPTHTHLVFSKETETDPLIFISINEVDKSIPDTISIKRLKDIDTKKLTPVNLGFFAIFNDSYPSVSATPEECSIIITRPGYFIKFYNDNNIESLNAYANAIYENMDLISQGIWDFQDAVKNMSLAFGRDVLGILGLMEYKDHGTVDGRLACQDLYINNAGCVFHKSGLSVFLQYTAETWLILRKYFGTALSDKYDIIDDSLFGEDDT